MARLAIFGGKPVRRTYLPYGRQTITRADRAAVQAALNASLVTQGPICGRFEDAFAEAVGAPHAVAVSSGTAALHAAMATLDLRPGDEVIVPAITFAATANAVLYVGARPVFADVSPETGLVSVASVRQLVGRKTRAVVAVHYAGHPCDMEALRTLARMHRLTLVVDAAHALGTLDDGVPVGRRERLCTFSTHPVKHITTGEGGLVTTTDGRLAQRLRRFRTHGIEKRPARLSTVGGWFYEMRELGYNYRLTEFAAALGLAQLARLEEIVARRRALAARYDRELAGRGYLRPVPEPAGSRSAYHLYPVLLDLARWRVPRREIFAALHAENIGVQVHYIPVYHHPYYRKHLGTRKGLCPGAEWFYARELSLPLFPGMTYRDQDDVLHALDKVYEHYGK